MNSARDSRTDLSSSTTAITGTVRVSLMIDLPRRPTPSISSRNVSACGIVLPWPAQSHPSLTPEYIRRGLRAICTLVQNGYQPRTALVILNNAQNGVAIGQDRPHYQQHQ